MAFAANQQQNENYIYKDMLKQPNCKEFVVAMLEEIAVHEGRNHWSLIKRSEVPETSFKQKRFPSGALMKHKARMCTHGGMQKWGVDF
eukprot:3881002-Ditylum_brightwellii.AAC.1